MTMTGSIITSMAGKPARGIVKHGPSQFLSILLLDIWGCSFGGPGCLRTAVEQDLVKDCVSKYIWISVRSVTWGAHGHGTRSVWTNSIKSPGRFLMGKTTLNCDETDCWGCFSECSWVWDWMVWTTGQRCMSVSLGRRERMQDYGQMRLEFSPQSYGCFGL